LASDITLNPRIAPPMIGLGLVEAIAAEDLAANADPEDRDGDGISGRFGRVGAAIGRFGWKATTATTRDQAAVAFSNDMGLSARLHPEAWGDCTDAQTICRTAIHGDTSTDPEVVDELLDLVSFYSANHAVPARRDIDDAEVLADKPSFTKPTASPVTCQNSPLEPMPIRRNAIS